MNFFNFLKERNEKRRSAEKEKHKRKKRLMMMKEYGKLIREKNHHETSAKKLKKYNQRPPWGAPPQEQSKRMHKTQSEKFFQNAIKKKRHPRDSEKRRLDFGLTGFDIEKAKNMALKRNKLLIQKLKMIDSVMIKPNVKKALTERQKGEISSYKKKKKKLINNMRKKSAKEKEKRHTKIKKNLEMLEVKAKKLAKKKSKKKFKTMKKCRSTADLATNMTSRLMNYLRDETPTDLNTKILMNKEFDRIYKTYKNMMNLELSDSQGTPNMKKSSKLGRTSSKATQKMKKNFNGRSTTDLFYARGDRKGGVKGFKEKKKKLKEKYKKISSHLENQINSGNNFKKKKSPGEIKIKKKGKLKKNNLASLERKIQKKVIDISDSSSMEEEEALEEAQEEDEISNVSEKFKVLNGAATYIQKIFKGFLTRKKLNQLYDHFAKEMGMSSSHPSNLQGFDFIEPGEEPQLDEEEEKFRRECENFNFDFGEYQGKKSDGMEREVEDMVEDMFEDKFEVEEPGYLDDHDMNSGKDFSDLVVHEANIRTEESKFTDFRPPENSRNLFSSRRDNTQVTRRSEENTIEDTDKKIKKRVGEGLGATDPRFFEVIFLPFLIDIFH